MNSDMQKHARIVSIILMVLGVIYLLAAGFVAIFGLMATNSNVPSEDVTLLPTMFTGGFVVFPLLLVGTLHILTGRAFRAGRGWSRVAVWILSVLNLGNVPVGTGIAIYAIWVLVKTREDALAIGE